MIHKQQQRKDEGFFIVSFDMASPKRLKDRLTPADTRRSHAVRRINSRFLRPLKYMGFRSQRSMFVVPNTYKQELQEIKSHAERALRRLKEPYSIFLLTCMGKNNRAVLKSVSPEVEKSAAILSKAIQKRGDKVLTSKLRAKTEKMIPLIRYFNKALAESLEKLVQYHSKEVVIARKAMKASEEVNKHYDRVSLFNPDVLPAFNPSEPTGPIASIPGPVHYPLASLSSPRKRPQADESSFQPQLGLAVQS